MHTYIYISVWNGKFFIPFVLFSCGRNKAKLFIKYTLKFGSIWEIMVERIMDAPRLAVENVLNLQLLK